MRDVLFFLFFFPVVFKLKNNKLIKSTLCFSNLGSTRDSVKISHSKSSTISCGPHGGPALGVFLVPISGHSGSHCHHIRVWGSSIAPSWVRRGP